MSASLDKSCSEQALIILPDKYFQTHLELSQKEANELHYKYYREYGLAIEGLVRHHKINALDYNEQVDDALPLDNVIKPDPELRKLIEDVDTSKVRLWLLTNAYVTHGKRVVKLLKVDDLFEGMTYCDYSSDRFVCKPQAEMFDKAMQQAGVTENTNCYFVGTYKMVQAVSGCRLTDLDDSYINCKAADERGWKVAHYLDPGMESPPQKAAKHQIRSLQELRKVFPEVFKSS